MDESDAIRWLEQRTGDGADSDAALTPETLRELLDDARIADLLCRLPGEVGYVETWDLNKAAAEGWRIIAARFATTRSATNLDSDRSPDDFRFLNANRQAEFYNSRRVDVPWLF